MADIITIHPDNPQPRLLRTIVSIVEEGGVIAYPTDSSYALGCAIGNKSGMDRIRRLRQMPRDHMFSLVCTDLAEIATYARVSNTAYRLLKSLTPGPYTFILRATSEVPKRLQDAKRRAVGIRVPDNRIAQELIRELGEPLMSSTLMLPGDDLPLTDPEDIARRLGSGVDAVVAGGAGGIEPTSVLDLCGDSVVVVRRGKGDLSGFDDEDR
jgi:tRNA threonylcarbamoyl adenosine modification protein (Sua5/YciO/YrdC/YwlC family)